MKESQHTEWKEFWRDEYLRWICGFANAEGGALHLGKNNKGAVVGLPNAARLLEEISNKVRDLLGIVVEVNLHHEVGKDWLEILVDPYPSPISYRGEYHVRSGSTKQELKGAALDKFLLRKLGRHWDGVPVPHAALSDLDTQALADFRKRAERSKRMPSDVLEESDAMLIEKLHLMEGDHLKRAALLLFHPDPERFVTGAFVKIGYFGVRGDLEYQDEIHGCILSQARETMERLLAKYLKANISYQGIQRFETYPVPQVALREALLNALAHKDYATSTPIQISVYSKKLMIWNPGQLPESWTVERLKDKHPSLPYNPDVANAFFRAGMIESWGRGIERIYAECESANAPAPQIQAGDSGLWVTFELKETTQENPDTTQETTQETSDTTQEITDTTQETSDTTQERILVLLRQTPAITRKELAQTLGLSTDGIKYHLSRLKAQDMIQHHGSTKAGYWEVRNIKK